MAMLSRIQLWKAKVPKARLGWLPRLTRRTSAQRFAKLERVYGRIRRAEDRRDVALCRQLDAGFAIPVFHWAEGKPLEDVLAETELAPGDFVRNCKQLLDLLRQVEDVASPETSRLVREARGSVFHGVVAYTGV